MKFVLTSLITISFCLVSAQFNASEFDDDFGDSSVQQNESNLFKYLEENYADIVEFTGNYIYVSYFLNYNFTSTHQDG